MADDTIRDYIEDYMNQKISKPAFLFFSDESVSDYTRLILATLQPGEDYIDGLIRVYNDEICETIDNYNCSAYYEPSYVITRAYLNGGFESEKKSPLPVLFPEPAHKQHDFAPPRYISSGEERNHQPLASCLFCPALFFKSH